MPTNPDTYLSIGLALLILPVVGAIVGAARPDKAPGWMRTVALTGAIVGIVASVGVVIGGVAYKDVLVKRGYAAMEHKYDFDIEKRVKSGGLDIPTEWKIDGDWRRCYVEDPTLPVKDPVLLCETPTKTYAEFDG